MVDFFINYLQFERRYSKHTLTAYKADLLKFQNHLEIFYPDLEIDQVDYRSIRSWIISLKEEDLDSRSINRKIATLRSFYKFLLSEEKIKYDPTQKLKILKMKKSLPNFVGQKDILSLLDQHIFSDDFFGWRDKLILELLYATGMRLSELINLKETDISSYDGIIKVKGKRSKERFIPFTKNLEKIIKNYICKKNEYFESNSYDFLIVTNIQEQSYPMLIYRIVKKHLDMYTTVEKRSPHVLRHTFATHLLDKGADLNAVKDLLGHTGLAATQVYTHNTLDKLKKIFDQAHPKA
ncbi:MAG: tyrosine-type recombinase/integrase [Bacteroidota bacterium]|nr:tyrosine-type recombinase/integrase [Bacteroidota bacterium]